jgi:phosphoglycerol transferase MdoB-like AlkP superfamily enzyme
VTFAGKKPRKALKTGEIMANQGSSGGGVVGLLGVVFVVLKLTHVIEWSWFWVTLPFWGGLALFLVFAIIVFVVMGAVEILK